MPEGDIDPRLVLAVLLAALAVALAFFGFLHWRRRAAGRPRAASRRQPWAPQPTGSRGTQRETLDDPPPAGPEQHYGVLGLGPGASPGEASGAYRRLSREWNPDRFREGSTRREEAEERSRSINVAFDTIRGTWSESEREVAEAFDQITSSTDAAPGARPALIESWLALGVGAKLAAIWLAFFVLLWLVLGILPVALLFSFIGFGLSHVLIGPGRRWANLLLFVPLLVAGAATQVFEAQDWRALALMLFLIPTHVGIWIWRSARGGVRGQQHKVSLILLGLLLMLAVMALIEHLPDCLPGLTGGC